MDGGVFITGVYGAPDYRDREEVWNAILNLNRDPDKPWCLVGDFNAIRHQEEKEGNRPPNMRSMREFNSFVNEASLVDMEYTGARFTWSNNQEGADEVKQRIDRGLCNISWSNLYPTSNIIHKTRAESDHCPILLLTEANVSRTGPRRFYYEKGWKEAIGYNDCVERNWQGGRNSNENLKALSRGLTAWKKETIGVDKDKIEQLMGELHYLQTLPTTLDRQNEEKTIRDALRVCWKIEEEYWSQRSRVSWLRLGDRNTSFFHASAVQRRKRNNITRLMDEAGEWIEEKKELMEHITGFYKHLFREERRVTDFSDLQSFPKLITEGLRTQLDRQVSEHEIKTAVFQLGPTKSPGPDGYPGCFFQTHWELIKGNMVAEIQSFFQNSKFPAEWNKTNLSLIPKVRVPERITQFRPISVANFRAKVISKILANMLKPFLPKVVSKLQSAFTGERSIQDSIIIIHEVVHRLKNRKKGKKYDFLLKLDMQKAYDRVDWQFLLIVLEVMGFGRIWISWIREIISSVSFTVVMNGQSGPSFRPTRGIRQGDPLSPFLFILVSNAMSFLLEREVEQKWIMGLRMTSRCPVLTHILFADDTVIFGRANLKEAEAYWKILNRYCTLSGQAINRDKSAILFSSNTPQTTKSEIAGLFEVNLSVSMGKYLGLPAEWGRSKSETFKFMMERLSARAAGWKSVLLSAGGKEVMVKAILQALPSYLFSVFLLPDTMLKKMDAIVARFWWAGDARKRTIHWCSIDNLAIPKSEGGLGFRSFKDFNLAFLAKLAWKIIKQPNALWVRILKAIYFPNVQFLEARQKRCSSWVWSSILQGRETLIKGIRKNVGNGEATWLDEPWFPGRNDFRCCPNPALNCRIADCILQGQRCWNVEKLRTIFPEDMVKEIRMIPIGPPNRDDTWLWHRDKKGRFSVKSCYWMLKEGNPRTREQEDLRGAVDWKWLWQLDIPSKVKFFLWRGCRNILPTRRNLNRRNCSDTGLCLGCGESEETTEHMLLHCPRIRTFWEEVDPSIRDLDEESTFKDWLMQVKNKLQPAAIIKTIGCCWTIWKQRNDLVFRNENLNITGMKRRMESEVALWYSAYRSEPQLNPNPGTINVSSVPLSMNVPWTIQCDGSYQEDIHKAGIGVIAFDSEGHAFDGRAGSLFCRTPSVAEAYAVLAAVQMAKEMGREVQIMSDCIEVTNAVQCPQEDWPWEIGAIIADITIILQEHPNISVIHCRRTGVSKAHEIANRARQGSLFQNWLAAI
ncbi:LINE-1 retrotransposable element ORF2 protein [Linum perenne]